ncbi:hypothetical protein LBMAG53_20060 [Planctomycetota bacterium]|nr:hypothetical protein LBMAG53_20060 [Planctomycetota bacterium]
MIVLATLNARHAHAHLGLRCLLANLGDLRAKAVLVEGTINDDLMRMAERILAPHPRIVGLSVSIWNRTPTLRLIRLLRAADSTMTIILGGPEPTYASSEDPLAQAADTIIGGEADIAFAEACRKVIAGERLPRRIDAVKPDLASTALPFDEYDDRDLATRLISVEATRGCAYSCEFCLSSLDRGVRGYSLDLVLAGLDRLIARGCRTFRFVDRTFNLDPRRCRAIIEFFLERWPKNAAGERIGSHDPLAGGPESGAFFLHFEMVPDRLIPPLVELLPLFPEGGVQLEIGIQSLDETVNDRISRHQVADKAIANLRWLRERTGCHLHVDLIVGLPGEGLAGFCAGFDRLYPACMDPGGGRAADLQVGILKLLPGTPLVRHREAFSMVFDPDPPYEVLATRDLDFTTLLRLKRLARWVELTANSHRFDRALAAVVDTAPSPSAAFLALADDLSARFNREYAIAEQELYVAMAEHLRSRGLDPLPPLVEDFLASHPGIGTRRKGVPQFLVEPIAMRLDPRRAGAGRDLTNVAF